MDYKKLHIPDEQEPGPAAETARAEKNAQPVPEVVGVPGEPPARAPASENMGAAAAAPAAPGSAADHGRLIHLAQLAGLLLLAYLAYTGTFSRVSDGLGGHHVDSVNRGYIQMAGESATALVDVLSASKVVLALLTSSKGGISFFIDIQVQLGQALSAVYEMANYAWLFAMASLAATKMLALLLDLGRLSMAPVLTLFFCCLGLWLGLRSWLPRVSGALWEAARLLLFATLLVHLVVPLAVYGVAAAGHHYFQGQKKDVQEGFSALRASLPKHDPEAGLHSQVESSVRHFKDKQGALNNTTSTLSDLTVRHIVLVLGEFLLAPLLFFSALAALVWRVLRKAWIGQESNAVRIEKPQ